MADIEITVDGGTSKRLLTAGKYCDRDILVTATGGGGGEPDPPDDGKTRLYITIPPNAMPDRPPPRNEVPLYIQQTVDRGVTIDWGDGSEPETLPGTGKVNTTHTYQLAGDYSISLDPAEGCELGLGDGDVYKCVVGGIGSKNSGYGGMLKRAIIGRRVTAIGSYSFQYCFSLDSVFISDSVTRIESGSFRYCYSLTAVIIPVSVTSIEQSAFQECRSLSLVSIPNTVVDIESGVFQSCYSITSVIIPASVTTIKNTAFKSCRGIKEYHLFSATPPQLTNIDALSGINPDCIIYVPVGSLEAYQSATNWSTYADQMREEET